MMIITQDGDVLDLLCLTHMGHESAVADVLQKNLHLADLDPQGLPGGVPIDLGETAVATAERQPITGSSVQLWD